MDPPLPTGHDCDTVNGEVLMTRLSVRDGRLVLPDGMSYRLLALPQRDSMTPEALAKIAALVKSGASVVGLKPVRSSSLKNYPKCDDYVKSLADQVWGPCDGKTVTEHTYGKGRVIWGRTLQDILEANGLPPDFAFTGAQPDASLDYIHRHADNADVYFVSNQRDRVEEAVCAFRVNRRQPELWDPLTGKIRDAAAFTQTSDGRTTVPLEFAPLGSVFVVFRKSIATTQNGVADRTFPTLVPLIEIKGPWTVAFDTKWGEPGTKYIHQRCFWTGFS